MEPEPVLCDTDAILDRALPNLQASSTLIFNCEGVNLGERGGFLSLITLRTIHPSSSQCYLIDIVRLSPAALSHVFTLLRSSSILKIVFDGRMGFSSLYHEYGVEIQGILDLQLVDVASRRESPEEHLERLGKYLKHGEINANERMYVDVHRLSGLAECVREHTAANPPDVSKGQAIYTYWGLRHLPEDYIACATADATLIHTLFDKFTELGHITPSITALSHSYVSMWKVDQPFSNDSRIGHPLLPLGIINHTSSCGTTKSCTVCSRSLPESAFSKSSWRYNKGRKCWVCRAVAVKENNRTKRNWDDDDYGDGYDYDDRGSRLDSDDYGYRFDHGYRDDLDDRWYRDDPNDWGYRDKSSDDGYGYDPDDDGYRYDPDEDGYRYDSDGCGYAYDLAD